MKGFDPKFKDLPDYIIGITKEIWEDRKIATLHQYYADDMAVRSPASLVIGNKNVISATMATLAEFPDRTLLGEDVIWSGDEDRGFLSSHRLLSTATHTRSGMYGEATGKRLTYRILADCAVKDNQIYDEWLVRDQGAIVRQMGWDPKAFAADLIEREGGPKACVKPFTPAIDVKGKYTGRGNDHPAGERYANILERIMSADLAVIPTEYDRAAQLELPGGVTGHGYSEADQFWLGLRAALPTAKFEIHHQIGRDDPEFSPRAAVRWSLTGTHDGWGRFGKPTGAEVHVMAISHAEFGPWGLRREYVLFDETAIWKQILLKTG
ncbi:nuclear transport factor 2 family protein [Rhizobium sp. BK176]|uniref:nuclear transport factor 2 family protein n=1 Tax=Rhizobium sp. BK176 TaxID=2587071 RepID=UPI00216969A3|nr:nuclear transport factor 2 family protein [Rhizobium sp. BK176]MCS4096214.1 putative ester cyclase [Rhizobium sp. BK176]